VSWDSRFPEPIELPGGVKLASLREAIVTFVNTIPSSERGTPVVLTAAELITSAAECGGPIEFARIATLPGSQPPRLARVQSRSQGSVLGPPQVEARRMTDISPGHHRPRLAVTDLTGSSIGFSRSF
jgi:hypothetical protein